ncbi:UV radiation resistance-associated gene protein [Microplitis mediator]|uniref:UV radiation resistance-associated gene protein n=1 Tax=Microplitis mediator TaxID=375433 RepID=UPI00255496FB|nr:UV radiation resistance-associated gene protein [Microplitis mediator]
MEMKAKQGLVRDLDLTLQPRPAPRYKVWLPLATQQLRLRSLYQIIGYNLETDKNFETCWFYFTLHRSSMSSPLYTSEPIDHISPKWSSLEVPTLHATGLSTANEIVLRLWRRTVANDPTTDVTVFTWGISFTGLVYMGPKLSNNLESMLRKNSLIFHLYGGFFVPSYCLLHPPEFRRYLYMSVNNSEICDSYTVSKLSNLRNLMQSLKQRTESAQALRDRIASGESLEPKFKQTTLNRLLQPKRMSKEKKAEIIKIRKELEIAKFRTKLLEQERIRKVGELRALNQRHLSIMEENQDLGSLLMERYRELNKDIERLRDWRQSHIQMRECFVQTSAQLAYRRRQLISDLNLIYPIRQESERKFTINNVHLPDSEELDTVNDIQSAVGLGFVCHATQIIANILNVPTRYPIIHSGSRSRILDHITDNYPSKDRRSPLFARSKDKVQFNYGVYLLNKNIAQLRWYCGLPTSDLRTTLSNLASLMNLKPGQSLDNSKRTFSGSSLDTDNSNGKQHNVSLTPPFQKIIIDKELKLLHRPMRTISQFKNSKTTLSSSLDQGLDKPTPALVLGTETKRICKSEESAIDDKTLSLFRDRLSHSSEENVFMDDKGSRVCRRFNKESLSSTRTIETDIEITIPTSVCCNAKYEDSNSRQRSSNSISSCEMALSSSTTEVDRRSGNPGDKINGGECHSLVEVLEATLMRSVNNSLSHQHNYQQYRHTDDEHSNSAMSSASSSSAFEKTENERSQETLTYFNDKKDVNGLVGDIINSSETLSSSAVSLDDTGTGNSCQRVQTRSDVASSCPESAKSFYDDSDVVTQRNWRTESNPSLETSAGYEQVKNRGTVSVSTSQSQPNRVQEVINDYRTSSELIDSIRRSSENVFARTEALASKKTSFKVMKPRS